MPEGDPKTKDSWFSNKDKSVKGSTKETSQMNIKGDEGTFDSHANQLS